MDAGFHKEVFMMKRWLSLGLVSVGALVLVACGGGSGRGGTDIAVTGEAPDEPVQSGATAVFVMRVANIGDNDASDIALVNLVGNQLALTGISCKTSGDAVCPPELGVSMTVPSLPPGSSLTFDIETRVGESATGAISNTLSATYAEDTDRVNNSATVAGTAFSLNSDVAVTGVGPSAEVPAGGSAEFVMTVTNAGPDDAEDVHIVNTPGQNLTVRNITCTATGGVACPKTLGVVMDVATMPVGSSLSFVVTTAVAPGTDGSISNTMVATPTNDSNRANNTGVAVGSADAYNLGVSATGPAGTIPGGSVANFTMVVTNAGPANATDVKVTNSVGANLTLGKIVCTPAGGAVCPAVTGASMVAPSIPAGGSLSFNVAATITAGTNGTVTNTMTVSGIADTTSNNNSASASATAVSADLGVSQTGAATVNAGSVASFTVVLANPGPGPASDVTLTETLTAGYSATVSCTATTGVVCPDTSKPTKLVVASLPAGRSLTFVYQVPVAATQRGKIVNSVSISSPSDPNSANNSASVTTLAIDPLNGTYKAFAADGREYTLTVDFDAGSYTMDGNGKSVKRSFTAAGNGDFTVSGASRFRVATDLLVGGHDFGAGVLPYIAARKFVTSLGGLAGVYNMVTRTITSKGSAATYAATARASGNVLQVCQSVGSVTVAQECPFGDLTSYTVSVSADGLYTGTVATGATEPFSFRLAQSGAATVLLGANASDGGASRSAVIALLDAAALAGAEARGASTSGDWLSVALSVTPETYTFTALDGSVDFALLQRINSGGPFSMWTGFLDSDTSKRIYVMQASPLIVMFGDAGTGNGVSGGASGLLQVSIP